MVKQIIILVLLSVGVILFKPQIDWVLNMTVVAHEQAMHYLSMVFSKDTMGVLLQSTLALLVIPASIALLASVIYWAIKRTWLPVIMEVVWVSWIILFTTISIKGM